MLILDPRGGFRPAAASRGFLERTFALGASYRRIPNRITGNPALRHAGATWFSKY